MRIDDLDPLRSLDGSASSILRTLENFGLAWDGEVLYQRRRLEAYRAALEELERQGCLYPCTCSRKELAMSLREGQAYPGFCRRRRPEPGAPSHALRVLTRGDPIRFLDRIQGPMEQHVETEAGDFVVLRRDRVYAYHLATVVDDREQGITEVLRGIDLLEMTPRQIFLQRLLGFSATEFAHIPVLVDQAGYKLSKQTHAPAVVAVRPSETLYRLLVLLRQMPPPEARFAPVADILDWAVRHWRLAHLRGVKSIVAESGTASPADDVPLFPGPRSIRV